MKTVARMALALMVIFGSLQVPTAAGVDQGPCFEFRVVDVTPSPLVSSEADVTIEATNACQWAVSFIAIGTGGLTRVAPAAGTYTSKDTGQKYTVEWTNRSGNPGFESIKFTATNQVFRHGRTDQFVITVQEYMPDYVGAVQGHAGSVFETYHVNYAE